jgi:hypothetical protein
MCPTVAVNCVVIQVALKYNEEAVFCTQYSTEIQMKDIRAHQHNHHDILSTESKSARRVYRIKGIHPLPAKMPSRARTDYLHGGDTRTLSDSHTP